MSEKMRFNATELTEDELDQVYAGTDSKKKKAQRSKFKCIECAKGTHLDLPDNCSFIYFLNGKTKSEGYCKNGHRWISSDCYEGYDPAGAKNWFQMHK